ncbi:MAG TPA: hypothetical protein VKY57_00330 [Chitinispirillaceae bacterium]|nr:hypothetical protein [Chitinispirillaceae bacterium]
MRRVYKQLSVVIIILILYTTGNGEDHEKVPFQFDGFTVLRWNRSDPLLSSNFYGIIEGDITNSFPVSQLSAFDMDIWSMSPNYPAFTASGALGSEFGDPMLNIYENRSLDNRDHCTLIETSFKPKRLPLRFFIGRRYYDHYTDRFDSLWNQYSRQTTKRMVEDSRGVAHGISGGYSLDVKRIKAYGFVNQYGYWGASPFFFSPVYRKGFSVSQTVRANTGSGTCDATVEVDHFDRYYDHQNPETFNDILFLGTYHHDFNSSFYGLLNFNYDSKIRPATSLGVSVADSLSFISWLVHCAIYGNGNPEAEIESQINPFEGFFIKTKASWEYYPRDRGFSFIEIDSPVYYHTNDFYRKSGKVETGYKFGTGISFDINCWYRYTDTEPWEIIKTYPESTVILYDKYDKASRHNGGASVGMELTGEKFSTKLWFDGGVSLHDAPARFNLPWRSFIEFSCGKPENNRFYGSIRYEIRSEAGLQYFDITEDKILHLSALSQDNLSLNIRVPVLVPFFGDRVQSAIRISFDSIHLFQGLRLRNHPGGNCIGPMVSLAFDGSF